MPGMSRLRPFAPLFALVLLSAAALSAEAATAARMVLPFIEDDYPRAVAQAKARKVPIFVESWAPW